MILEEHFPRAQLCGPFQSTGASHKQGLDQKAGCLCPLCRRSLAEAQALLGRLSVWITGGRGQAKSLPSWSIVGERDDVWKPFE